MKKVELLSPCGDMECLKAAIYNGADAVYLGGESFGARAFAKNFNRDEIKEAVKLAHLYGVRVYVTVNTIMFEEEIDYLTEYVSFLHKTGVDALIVQDLGVMNLIRNTFPNMEIHASTQAHNYDNNSLEFMKKMGCKRAVLAREVSLDDIKNMTCDIEKEVFVHGALCLSYSGNCLFSALNNNRSGNRGACAQSCRMKYKFLEDNKYQDIKDEYLLSTRSLFTLDRIGDLIDANISSFKIEGRMKSKEYVGYVTRLYREKIDEYYRSHKVTVIEEEINNLKVLYNRDFTNGYIFNKYNKDFMNISSCNHIGIVIGDVLEIDKKYIKIKLRKDLNQEDGIRFDNGEGMIVNRLYNFKKLLVSHASSGEIIYLDNKFNLSKCKIIRKTIDKKLNDEINNFEPRRVGIDIKCNAKLGETLYLEIKCDKDVISTTGNVVESSINAPITSERIKEQLTKLGGTPFNCNNIEINSSDNIFISIKELNELRRELIDKLINIRENKLPHEYKKNNYVVNYEDKVSNTNVNVYVRTKEQLEVLSKYKVDSIYTGNKDLYNEYKNNLNIFYNPSRVDKKENFNNEKILVNTSSQIDKYINNNTLYGDTYLNVLNSYSIDYLEKLGLKRICLSYESTIDNIKEISKHKSLYNVEVIVYGTPELMIMKHDVIGYLTNSNEYDHNYELESINKDRFKVVRKDNLTTIYHKEPINRLDQIKELKELNIGNIRVDLLNENKYEVDKILKEVFYE